MLCALILTSLLTSLASATPEILERNLAYRSPYLNEPALGIDTRAVHERHLQARSEIKRDIDSGRLKRSLSRRQEQTNRPDGEPSTYTYAGYGLAVTNWADTDYIYAGGLNYTHAVASGDPWDTSIILWTRAEPTDTYRIDVPVCVKYKVWSSEDGTGDCVSSGWALTGEDVDWTVKVEATGLSPFQTYSYQFSNCADDSNASPKGITKTAPGKLAKDVPNLRFSVYSCSNYPAGFFSAYSGPVVHSDTDYAVHVGDYIYEGGGTGGENIGRAPSKGLALASLDDYRKRYAQYRTDIDLQNLHLNIPMIAVWDDHEVADNSFKEASAASNDSISTGGCKYSNNTVCFTDRAMHAKRAYHEWIPIRATDLSDDNRIWRDFRFGDLVDIFALDTRQYERDITDIYYNTEYVSDLAIQVNSSRSITGPKQEKWLLDGLSRSSQGGTKWRLLLNQVIMGTLNNYYQAAFPESKEIWKYLNFDAWDGYQGSRQRLLQHVWDEQIDNVIAVTGDTHAAWLNEISFETTVQGSKNPNDTTPISLDGNSYQKGTIIEYGGSSVSSNGWGASLSDIANATAHAQQVADSTSGLLFSEGYYRGYMHLDISYDQVTCSWYSYPGNQEARVPDNRTLAFQSVQLAGVNQIQRPLQQPAIGAIRSGN